MVPFITHSLKVTLHSIKEFLLIDIAIQLPKNLVASVIPNTVITLVPTLQLHNLQALRGFIWIKLA